MRAKIFLGGLFGELKIWGPIGKGRVILSVHEQTSRFYSFFPSF